MRNESIDKFMETAIGQKPKERKLGRLKASSILFSPIKDSLKKSNRVLDTKELVKKVRTKK